MPQEGAENVVTMAGSPAIEDPLSYYARQVDGLWYIPRTVDRGDPWIRLLVLGPSQPLLVDIAVMVDGQPYRAARERWMDLLLEQARDKSLIAGALDVSIDEAASLPDDSEKQNEEHSSPDDDATDTDEKVPTIKVRRRESPSVVKRLINYLAAGGAEEDREEIRWLIAEWAGGPALLSLGPAFSWQRAKIAPLWNCLDRDNDHLLSASEVSQSFNRLRQADINEDEVVELKELERSGATQSSPYTRVMSHPLIVVLNGGTAWNALRKTIRKLYGMGNSNSVNKNSSTLMARVRHGDPSISNSDLAGLMYVPPEIVYRVDFGKEGGKVSLLAFGEEQGDFGSLVSATEQVITVSESGTYLEFSSASGEAKSKLDLRRTQISVGAVVDGFPLFRLLDRDNNRRLSLREQRQLEACLTACDLNGDGQIVSTEIPTAIRLTVTHGVHVHERLRLPTGASHEIGGEDKETAPAWFSQMDRNRDGDLSRVEFLGTTEQFKLLDHNGDGLVSKGESQEK